MKKSVGIGLLLILLLGLCACGHKAETTEGGELSWQEQYDLGIRYLSEGNYEEAIIAFEAAIKIDPKRPEGYSGLAEAYLGADDLESALAILESGIAETGDADLEALLAELQAESESDEDRDNAWDAYRAGVEAYLAGSYHEALELLDTAISTYQTSATYARLDAADEWATDEMMDGEYDIALFAGAAARVCYAMGDTSAMLNYFFLAEAHMYLGPPYYNNGFHDDWGGINVNPGSGDGEIRAVLYSLYDPWGEGNDGPEVLVTFDVVFDENGEVIQMEEVDVYQ